MQLNTHAHMMEPQAISVVVVCLRQLRRSQLNSVPALLVGTKVCWVDIDLLRGQPVVCLVARVYRSYLQVHVFMRVRHRPTWASQLP